MPAISPPAMAPEQRHSLRTIARLAQVSPMTVSRALRNQPKVSERVRAHVLKIVESVGYRPDPEVAKLMHYLRNRTKPRLRGSIYALTDRRLSMDHPYIEAMIAGARRQADALGYGFELIHFERDAAHARQLRRVLWARGAQGILILPLRQPLDLSGLLPWEKLSAVAATSSVLSPGLHQAIPNHFGNMLLLCGQLARRGCRRIGLAIESVQDERVNHVFSATVSWYNQKYHGTDVPPLIFDAFRPSELRRWFAQARPTAIIASDDAWIREFARHLDLSIPGPIRFACTSVNPATKMAGINELPAEIGGAAVDLISGLIQRGVRGPPPHAIMTQVQGRWVEGISCTTGKPCRRR